MHVETKNLGAKKAALCAVMIALLAVPVWAQRPGGRHGGPPPGGGPEGRLSRDDIHAVWQLQSDNVASSMNLSAEDTRQLREAYVEARRATMGRMGGNRGDGPPRGPRREGPPRGQRGDRPPRENGDHSRERFREGMHQREGAMNAAHDQLFTTLSGFLSEDQTALAIQRLGTPNRQWDALVHAARGLNLGGNQSKVLTLLNDYAIDSSALMRNAQRTGDMESVREGHHELRGQLDDEMATILSADQFRRWQETSRFEGPRGPRGPEGDRARRGGGHPDGPPHDGRGGGRGPRRGGPRGEHPPPPPPQQ